jgi:hypothetical protein
MLFWQKDFEDGKCPSPELLQPWPRTHNFYYDPELNVKPIEKYLTFEPLSGTECQLHGSKT